MSLYAAEDRARSTREEILLSRLFGTLFMVNREGYLGGLFQKTGMSVAPADLATLQIQFWPELGAYSPDVVIEGDSTLLFVVARRRNALDVENLVRLAENGWKLSPRFRLLLVTDGKTQPGEVEEMENALPKQRRSPLAWIGWSQIYSFVHQTLRSREENATTRELIGALLALFAAERLAPFVGFDGGDLRNYRESIPSVDRVYTTAGLLVSDFDALLAESKIRRISTHTPGVEEIRSKAPRSLEVRYADESWDPAALAGGGLFLKADYLVGEIHLGFESDTTDPRARALLVEARQHIVRLFEKEPDLRVRLAGARKPGPARDASLIAQLETHEGAARISRVELVYIFDGERDDLLPVMAEKFIALRDFAGRLPLLPLQRQAGESQFVVAGA